MNNTTKLSKNLTLTHIDDEKFKAGYVSVYFATPRTKQNVTNNFLMVNLMRTSCKKYDTALKLDRKLEQLYDSQLLPIVEPMGQYHLVGFRVKLVQGEYLPEDITENALDLLSEIILRPNLSKEGFDEKYFDIEKKRHLQLISSDINDKTVYARMRARELMFTGTPIGIRDLGYKEELEKITPSSLYDHYKKVIANSAINVTFAGKFDIKKGKKKVQEIFDYEPNFVEVEDVKVIKEKKFQEHVEKLDLTQAKMVMYYKFGISPEDEDYYDFIIFNSVFGSGAHSKLFMNVREKHSLCYSISSSIQKQTGTAMVYSAIDPSDYEKAVELIDQQMDDIKDGNITDEELNSAKKSYITALESMEDSLKTLSDFYYRQSYNKTPRTIMQIKAIIEKVTKQDVENVAKKGQLCFKYLLTKNETKL